MHYIELVLEGEIQVSHFHLVIATNYEVLLVVVGIGKFEELLFLLILQVWY